MAVGLPVTANPRPSDHHDQHVFNPSCIAISKCEKIKSHLVTATFKRASADLLVGWKQGHRSLEIKDIFNVWLLLDASNGYPHERRPAFRQPDLSPSSSIIDVIQDSAPAPAKCVQDLEWKALVAGINMTRQCQAHV